MSNIANLSKDLAQIVSDHQKNVVHVKGLNSLSGIRWHKEGLVITSARIALGKHPARFGTDTELEIRDSDGKEHKARLLGVDAKIDLAVFKVEGLAAADPKHFAAASHRPQTGEIVVPLGRPGKVGRAALGLVAALSDESWQTPEGGHLSYYLEVDGNLPEGFSGGPLVSAAGTVLGMNTMAMPRGSGMTVPIADIEKSIKAIEEGKSFKSFYLGINSVPVPNPRGLLVTEIDPGSPADTAGLIVGDVIQKIDSHEMGHYGDLMQVLAGHPDGKATLSLVRAGKTELVETQLVQK